jgi:hypothetical protein
VLVAESRSFAVSGLFMLLVMAMIAVEQVPNLANFVLEVNSFYLGIVEFGVYSMFVRRSRLDGGVEESRRRSHV